jgi:hypothetical protein
MILEAYRQDPKFNRTEYAEENGIHLTYITDVIRQAKKSGMLKEIAPLSRRKREKIAAMSQEKKDQQMAKVMETMDSRLIETEGKDIRTAEQAMEYCGTNPDEWDITKKVVNFWDMGEHRNWQVKVWLKRKDSLSAEAAIERLLTRLPKFKYSKFKPLNVDSKSGNLGIICNFDAHIGKLAWDIETGQGDYDLPISEQEFDYVTDKNLSHIAPMKPEKMIFVIGQDMMHYENLEGVTPKGRNILDTDGRLGKLQDVVIDVCVRNILKCRALAPTEVVLVQGNHDQTSSLWLSKVLRAWFKDDEHVTFDCEPRLRKHRLWGKSFIGLAHKIMPTKIVAAHGEFSTGKDSKEDWGKAEFRDILFGDQHKKMQWKIGSLVTHGACNFRQLTALSKIDYWHYENLFTDAVPGGEAFVFNKKFGCFANFTAWSMRG